MDCVPPHNFHVSTKLFFLVKHHLQDKMDEDALQKLLRSRGDDHNQLMDSTNDQINFGGFTPGGLLHNYFAEQQRETQQQVQQMQSETIDSHLLSRYMSATSNAVLPSPIFELPLSTSAASQQSPVFESINRPPFILNTGDSRLEGPNRAQFDNRVARESDVFAQHGILGPWSATSAGLLGNLTLSTKEIAKKPKRKEKGRPKRPLSAYNLFFKDERPKILKDQKKQQETDGDSKEIEDKRIGFQNLAKIIGQRWHDLSPERTEYYKALASKDMVRYRSEMEIFSQKKAAS